MNSLKLGDYEVRNFENTDQLKEYLEYRSKNDIWYSSIISKCKVLYKKEKDSMEDFIRKNKISELSSTEAIDECVAGINIFFSFVAKGKRMAFPIRYTALTSMYERAGWAGKTIYATEEKDNQRILDIDKKIDVINWGLELYDNECKILVRDEKISAILSNQYAILPDYELEHALSELLEREYPMAKLIAGSTTHEYITFEYNLNDDEMEEDLRSRLEENGMLNVDVHSRLKFLTSDIGFANASVFPYFIINGSQVRIGKEIATKHMGKKTIEDFAKQLPKINTMFKNDMKNFEKLCSTVITHPADCFRAIAAEVILPKKIAVKLSEKVRTMYPVNCRAIEIYMALHEILDTYKEESKEQNIVAELRIQEAIASSMYLDYKEFDYPFEWKRGE